MDYILVLKNGKLIEQGTYQQLLAILQYQNVVHLLHPMQTVGSKKD
ncbi:hypothetical protein [Limosilactobacillus reuteri]|uniref:ABC transporter ATP-binding protein n=1 Tax=Limosilactobacillus reuteri TaxID=1598 RepID=A0A7X2G254_LIMRT|nr:hypothetical protein [Limosilactobacillus reuteri]MRG90305.1 hypothetical protein [Limosilactobacillus reuteri]